MALVTSANGSFRCTRGFWLRFRVNFIVLTRREYSGAPRKAHCAGGPASSVTSRSRVVADSDRAQPTASSIAVTARATLKACPGARRWWSPGRSPPATRSGPRSTRADALRSAPSVRPRASAAPASVHTVTPDRGGRPGWHDCPGLHGRRVSHGRPGQASATDTAVRVGRTAATGTAAGVYNGRPGWASVTNTAVWARPAHRHGHLGPACTPTRPLGLGLRNQHRRPGRQPEGPGRQPEGPSAAQMVGHLPQRAQVADLPRQERHP